MRGRSSNDFLFTDLSTFSRAPASICCLLTFPYKFPSYSCDFSFFSKVFYGGQPWPSSLTAMTALNWRKISSNSSSCKQLQDADSRLRERFQPTSPFSLGRHHRVTSCDSQQGFTQQTQQMLDYQSATLCVL